MPDLGPGPAAPLRRADAVNTFTRPVTARFIATPDVFQPQSSLNRALLQKRERTSRSADRQNGRLGCGDELLPTVLLGIDFRAHRDLSLAGFEDLGLGAERLADARRHQI